MEDQICTSTVKINGIPVIPPLVTNDITIEIQYYKQLALAVEERLKALKIARGTDLKDIKEEPKNKDNFEVPTENNITNLMFESESNNNVTQDVIPNAVKVEYPTKDNDDECLIDISIPETEQEKNLSLIDKDINTSEPKQKQLEQLEKTISEDDKSCLNETFCGDSISTDAPTASTDLNQYLNTSASTGTLTTGTNTTETTPENWKPQVPKTLDIVPITLDQSKPADQSADGETPKLVRQGSYVLDTPSPMLLAHMQNELPNSEYTPTTSAPSLKRKEWSISSTKSDWDTKSNFKQPTSYSNAVNKYRKGYTNIPSQRNCKSVSNSKTGSPLDVYQPAKSVDCIQSMFAKDGYSSKIPSGRGSSQSQKYSSPNNGTNGIRNNGSKRINKTPSILNLANKLSGSLGSLGSNSPKPVRRIEKKNDNTVNLNKSRESIKSNESNTSISKQQKPVITSEKIVSVFREIQETHKKQMLELMSRQQREQMLMQENFKKQQILLLAQIRKAFPEISISALSEAITGKSAEHGTSPGSKNVTEKSDSNEKKNIVDTSKMNGITHCEKDQQTNFESPIDHHPSKELSSTSCHVSNQPTTHTVAPYYQSNCQATQTFGDSCSMIIGRAQLANVRVIDDIPVGMPMRRHSGVSRQLFPLDGRTIQPIFDNSMYTEKHIKAATKINAYARGYIVRRLMKTEKVIALKNTYREALHCMLRLHIDAPLNLPELNFHQRLQLQCDAASMNIVELFSQSPTKQMEIIAHDREVKKVRSDRPSSARSYSFATQRTLARKKMKEMGISPSFQNSMMSKSFPTRTRCQTWASNTKEKRITTSLINQGIKRSTSAGAVRKPWR